MSATFQSLATKKAQAEQDLSQIEKQVRSRGLQHTTQIATRADDSLLLLLLLLVLNS